MFGRFARAFPKMMGSTSFRTFATAGSNAFAKSISNKKLVVGSVVVASTIATTTLVSCADKVPFTGLPGTNYERTFIAIKPDGTERRLVGEIIGRFEKKGFKLVGIKILHPTPEQAAKHYDDLKSKPFFDGLVKYFSSGAVVCMVWEGKDVVKTGRKLIGETNPALSVPGSIRGDLCIEVGRNIIHGSDSTQSANDEITLWFGETEVTNYESPLEKFIYERK
ncbi:hypothetical protein DICPUDRAFT_93125 [Dictyostelium purpureum]|uniref:nucleoside-diphosphate kinase n=1 Tax=Dictyostelium purpureum TaxID=5786 RepID=F1A2K7_DICPU|nr:uncharacterized protein DICPUDRAFT_93125 [Dictyostelium purpureum]EGC29573.1 hypothetical protein DICPUDRAFT_93125 [Dictyostelium purpureum]|eukprot:XP_003293905.1 hypothetical protein DICPUDRAFT_93125 [Dictyostelium purpureum]